MKIGFLAMSGIRAHDPELLKLGLTLPGFVERSKAIASLPSLGLLYLAAVTPAGHELEYFEAEADGKESVALYDCDLVAISTFSAQVFEAYAIADRLRLAGVKVALGGLHVTALPAEAFAHADYVVTGEGENVWPEVVRSAERDAPPRTFAAQMYPAVDVTRLPVPRYDLLGVRTGESMWERRHSPQPVAAGTPLPQQPPAIRYNRFTVQTTRGCPWRCEFCASNVMLGQPYRKRPVWDVVRDIGTIQQVRERPFIEFADDNTFVDKTWGKQLCRALAPLHLKWFTETDISVAEDGELLELMHAAGCRQILIGLESPNASPLHGLEMKADFKARWFTRYANAIERIQSHGITVNGCFILGLDGHDTGIFEQVLDFARQVSLYDVQITVLTAFPGTPLYARLLREGRVIEPGRWDLCTLFDVNYRPVGMSADELRAGMRWLTERLYNDECTQARRAGFLSSFRRATGTELQTKAA
ncbi:MAG: radical SAM protein [Verrucomicrobiota bacterium]